MRPSLSALTLLLALSPAQASLLLEKRCVKCPNIVPSCSPPCKGTASCQVTPQTCEQCATAQCANGVAAPPNGDSTASDSAMPTFTPFSLASLPPGVTPSPVHSIPESSESSGAGTTTIAVAGGSRSNMDVTSTPTAAGSAASGSTTTTAAGTMSSKAGSTAGSASTASSKGGAGRVSGGLGWIEGAMGAVGMFFL